MKYLGWVDGEGNFYPHAGAIGSVEWRPTVGYLEEHEDGRVFFWTQSKLVPTTYPDLDTALVAIKLRV